VRHGQQAGFVSLAGLILILSAVSLAACGGGAKEVTSEELVTRANTACLAEQKAFSEIQAQPPAGAGAAADQAGDLADAVGDELGELKKMRAPAEQTPAYDRYTAAIDDAKGLLDDGADAAGDQDSKAYAEAQSKLADGKESRRRLAAKLGFTKCSPRAGPGA
jgi:hypothetical protein